MNAYEVIRTAALALGCFGAALMVDHAETLNFSMGRLCFCVAVLLLLRVAHRPD